MSSIEGLFAVGECANAHIHGANRLGGNSLLEIIAFGREAGEQASTYAKKRTKSGKNLSGAEAQKRIDTLTESPNTIDFYEKREILGSLCYHEAGIIREGKGLLHAAQSIEEMVKDLPQMGIFDKGMTYNTNLIERIKFENSLQLAQMILACAQKREESRGAHYRSDFPQADSTFEKESLCKNEEEGFSISFEEVAS